jgi:hypothetical protein
LRARIFRVTVAFVGASAFIAVALFVATDTQTQAKTAIPQHFGGPVCTSIYSPTATLGMPALVSSSAEMSTPLNAAS